MGSLPVLDRNRRKQLKELQDLFGIRFKKIAYLEWALQHRSYVNESPDEELINNEQLEFLGDSILGHVIAEHLFKTFPTYLEGRLSLIKSSVVNQDALADLAKQYRLGDYLLLGKGEEKEGGRERASILSDALEAVIAAYYLDRGFKPASSFLITIFKDLIKEVDLSGAQLDNAKNRLQKITQGRLGVLPEYILVSEEGPQHRKEFRIKVLIQGEDYGRGLGKTKKKAEENAAESALKKLK